MIECNQFVLTSASHTIEFNLPNYGDVDGSLSKSITKFGFWSEHYRIHDEGIAGQPVTITGIEYIPGINTRCFPLCFTFCFYVTPIEKFVMMDEIMDAHEEVTITGVGDCFDAVYIIVDFRVENVDRSPGAYRWTLSLEKKRELS